MSCLLYTSDLGGQADPLALAAGEGPRAAAEGQIAQAHGLEEPQPGLDLLQDPVCDQVLLVRQLQPVHPLSLIHIFCNAGPVRR